MSPTTPAHLPPQVPARVLEGPVPDPAGVLALIGRAAGADGFSAVNESGRLALVGSPAAASPGRRLHLIEAGNPGAGSGPVAYASLDLPAAGGGEDALPADDAAAGGADRLVGAELVVDPAHRRRGIGTALLRQAVALAAERAPGARFRVWAHRDTAPARALALAAGLAEDRVLLVLRRPAGPVGSFPLPAGVRIEAFRPGVDEQAWLAVNAAAFAQHPEQGRWTGDDLAEREAEPWFDPAGFLLAWSTGSEARLLGFHWTKIPLSPERPEASGAPAPVVGEIYVLGVAPDAGVRGLGTALAAVGLQSLADRGVGAVELYVEADNDRALRLYRRFGFTEHSRDVSWGRMLPGGGRP